MSTAVTPEEAVIISGPRKGAIVTLDNRGWNLSQEEELILDQLVEAGRDLAVTARETRETAQALLREIRAERGAQP
jgi:hypothetical protein